MSNSWCQLRSWFQSCEFKPCIGFCTGCGAHHQKTNKQKNPPVPPSSPNAYTLKAILKSPLSIPLLFPIQLSIGGWSGVQDSHSAFSPSCFPGSAVSTGQQTAGCSSSNLHMVAKLGCSFLWAELLTLLCIFLV